MKEEPVPALYTIPRRVQYSFTIQNRTNSPVRDAEFRTFAPLAHTPTQKCVHVETSHPHEVLNDALGNSILRFSFEELPPYDTKVIMVGADLLLTDTPNPAGEVDASFFLRNEKYCETSHPEIMDLARRLRGEDTAKTAENIFKWVSTRLTYAGHMRTPRGALHALKERKGDCTEFMFLFAALCRANGIPARCLGGYVTPESSVLKPAAYHNWAEFFDGHTWRIADPQRGVFMDNPSDYVALHLVGEPPDGSPFIGKRFFEFEGEGLHVEMNN